jgi:methyltransferase-like protein 6
VRENLPSLHLGVKREIELATYDQVVLQVGCGVGNTAFPLLEVNPDAYVYACDFARTAVEHVREHPNFKCGRIEAFEADITRDDLLEKIPRGELDFVTMVFVLSALDPSAMHRVSLPCPV